MKLYFLRHGLADRAQWDGSDFERPLTEEGRAEMLQEAIQMHHLGVTVGHILSSPLVRAKQTAEIVAKELNIEDRLVLVDKLQPGFEMNHLEQILQPYLSDEAVMLVGHEPDLSLTVSEVIGGGQLVCKKGGLARVDLYNLQKLAGELVWLVPPKLLCK